MKVCLFCSASNNLSADFEQAAKQWGSSLDPGSMELVYGAGACGLMGLAADGALEKGVRTIGVIPQYLAEWREVLHQGLDETVIVDTLLERKDLMIKQSDVFVALPGGLGTLDELFEVITWRQLGQLSAPIVLVNINGFFDPMLDLIGHLLQHKMIKSTDQEMLTVHSTVAESIEWLNDFARGNHGGSTG